MVRRVCQLTDEEVRGIWFVAEKKRGFGHYAFWIE
jgi:hypothetical protein